MQSDSGLTAKIDRLKEYFEQSTQCSVYEDWKIDSRCHRFYFEKDTSATAWTYILDVSQRDVQRHDTEELVKLLEAAGWLKCVGVNSGKKVCLFADGRLSVDGGWPE